MRYLSTIFLIFLLGMSSISCKSDKTEPKPPPVIKVIQQPTPLQETKTLDDIKKEQDAHCLNVLKELQEIKNTSLLEEESVKIKIETNKITDEVTLGQWIANLAERIYGKESCQWKSIYFLASLTEATFYEGVIRQSDYKLFQSGKISKAEWWRRFEIKEQDTIVSLKARLKQARQKNDYETAFNVLKKLQIQDPDNLSLKILEANIDLDQSKIQEAIALYEQLLSTNPKNISILYNLAFAQKSLGSFAKSIQTYQMLQNIIKDSVNADSMISDQDVWLQLADTYYKNNQVEEALQALDQIQDKSKMEYLILRSNVLRAQKKFEAAKLILVPLIEVQNPSSMALFNAVLLSMDLKDETGAKENYHKLKIVDESLAKELAFLKWLNEDINTNETQHEVKVEDTKEE